MDNVSTQSQMGPMGKAQRVISSPWLGHSQRVTGLKAPINEQRWLRIEECIMGLNANFTSPKNLLHS